MNLSGSHVCLCVCVCIFMLLAKSFSLLIKEVEQFLGLKLLMTLKRQIKVFMFKCVKVGDSGKESHIYWNC